MILSDCEGKYTFLSFDCNGKYAPRSWYYVARVTIVHVAVGIYYDSHMLVRLIPSLVHVIRYSFATCLFRVVCSLQLDELSYC